MIKSMALTFFFALLIFAFPAGAQFLGPPGYSPAGYAPIPSYGVPGAMMDPGARNWGSGQYMMAPPCGYGTKVANPIDDDEGVIDAKDSADDAKTALHDAQEDAHDAHVKLHEAEIALDKDLEGEDVTTIANTAKACHELADAGFDSVSQDCQTAAGIAAPTTVTTTPSSTAAVVNPDQRKKEWMCVLKSSSLATASDQAQCAHATSLNNAGGESFDIAHMCVFDNAVTADFKASGKNTTPQKYEDCRRDLPAYMDAFDKSKKADDTVAKAKKDITKSASALKKAKTEAQKLINEEKKLDADEGVTGDASVAGCPECAAAQRAQMSASTGINKTPLILGLALGGGEIAAQTMVNLAANRQNAQLGFPSGPNPYASAIGAGFPFIYGGLLGATMGGMAKGGYGCSPTVNGGYYGGGPWAGGMNGGMGYPYGGGMYNPGYGPGWGYAGPWGVNPQGMGYMPYGAGGFGPYGAMGPGGFAGMSPMGGFGGGMGMMPGMMGGPYGPFGPFGGGGFGAGIGMSPYGASPFGGPFAGAGGPFGMGLGGIGSPYGIGGAMGGLGGGLYAQQMQAQMQSMMDYQRRIQLYATTMGQSAQLQNQAYSYMGGGMGAGMGLMGGYGGYGGMMGMPYYGSGLTAGFGLGAAGLGFGAALGGGYGLSGVALPATPMLGIGR